MEKFISKKITKIIFWKLVLIISNLKRVLTLKVIQKVTKR